MKLISTLLSTLTLVSAQQAIAQQDQVIWGLGVAAISTEQGYKDVSRDNNIVPALMVQYGDFTLFGPRASYDIVESENFEMSVIGQLRFDGFEEADGDIFKGMEERDLSFDGGVSMEWDSHIGDIGLDVTTDLTGTHKGYAASLSYSVPFQVENGRIAPFISIDYQSDDLTDYYYGVRANEATSTRAFYQADAATNITLGISTDWRFAERHIVKADISYTAFDSSIEDSPLVDTSSSNQILVGYLYVF